MERDARLQSLHLHILQGPQVQEPSTPLQVPLTDLPQKDTSLVQPLPPLKFLVNEPPSRFPNGFAM